MNVSEAIEAYNNTQVIISPVTGPVTGLQLNVFRTNWKNVMMAAGKEAKARGLAMRIPTPGNLTRPSRYIEVRNGNKLVLTIRFSEHAAGPTRPSGGGEFLSVESTKLIRNFTAIQEAISKVAA